MVPNVQKTVEVPQIQYVDKVVEAPIVVTHQPVPVDAEALLRVEDVSVGTQTLSRKRKLTTENESADGNTVSSRGRRAGVIWTRFVSWNEPFLGALGNEAQREGGCGGEGEGEEREASFPDALADRTKVEKFVVDKWFVNKGFRFGRVPTGEVIFIHASVVQGAEVLTIGTDALEQVVGV